MVGVAGDLGLVRDVPGEADALDEAAQVLRVGGEVESDPRLDPRVGADQVETTACMWAFERDGQPDRERCAKCRDRLRAADAGHVDVAEDDLLHVVELGGAGGGVAQDLLRERAVRVAAVQASGRAVAG